jgi:hypothetical protein
MIYILSGNDTKSKNTYLKKLYKEDFTIFDKSLSKKEELLAQALSVSLFGTSPLVILENVIKEGNIDFKEEELSSLRESKTIFAFFEEKLLSADFKKYKKFATIEDFSILLKKQPAKMNVFGIADSFSNRNKIGTWMLYREAISLGISPEEISGIIFWKIKSMILTGTKFFSKDELKIISSNIVSIYHRAHRGDIDFTISLEQFILSSLSK